MSTNLNRAEVFGWAVVQTSGTLRNKYRGTSTREQTAGKKTQGRLKELNKGKCKPCTIILGSFSKGAASRLEINYFLPVGIRKVQTYMQSPKSCPSLGEGCWYSHGGGRSTQLRRELGLLSLQARRKGDLPQSSTTWRVIQKRWRLTFPSSGQWKIEEMFINHSWV